MPLPEIFYDQYDNPRAPALFATVALGAGVIWGALYGYPNSLKANTIERVEDAVEAMHPGAYVVDDSEKFNSRGRIQSVTDGQASVAVEGKICRIKFDTTPDGIDIFPRMGDVACAPLLNVDLNQ